MPLYAPALRVEYFAAHFYFSCYFHAPHIICPPSQYLAAAVPGDEEDHLCIWYGSTIRNQSKGPVFGAGMVGMSIEKTCVINQTIRVLWFWLPTYSPERALLLRLRSQSVPYLLLCFRTDRAATMELLTLRKLSANFFLGSVIFTGGMQRLNLKRITRSPVSSYHGHILHLCAR